MQTSRQLESEQKNERSSIAVEWVAKGVELYTKGEKNKAIAFFKAAAEKGDFIAYYNLGYCYEKGEGVTQDIKMASAYYQKGGEVCTMPDLYEVIDDTMNVIADMRAQLPIAVRSSKPSEKTGSSNAKIYEKNYKAINTSFYLLCKVISGFNIAKENLNSEFYDYLRKIVRFDESRDFLFEAIMVRINKIENDKKRLGFYRNFIFNLVTYEFLSAKEIQEGAIAPHKIDIWRTVNLLFKYIRLSDLEIVFDSELLDRLKKSNTCDITYIKDLPLGSATDQADGFSLYATLFLRNKTIADKLNQIFYFPVHEDILLAIKLNDGVLVKRLIELNPIYVNNTEYYSGKTLLMCAAEFGSDDVVKVLLKMNAESKEEKSDLNNLKDKQGRTAFDIALKNRHFSVAQQLWPTCVLQKSSNPLDLALASKNFCLVEFIAHTQPDIALTKRYFLNALFHNDPKKLNETVDIESAEASLGISAMLYAVLNKKINIIRWMLNQEKFLEQVTTNVLAAAIWVGDGVVLNALLSKATSKSIECDISKQKVNLLMFSAQYGRKETFIPIFNKLKSTKNSTDLNGETALDYSRSGLAEIKTILMDAGFKSGKYNDSIKNENEDLNALTVYLWGKYSYANSMKQLKPMIMMSASSSSPLTSSTSSSMYSASSTSGSFGNSTLLRSTDTVLYVDESDITDQSTFKRFGV